MHQKIGPLQDQSISKLPNFRLQHFKFRPIFNFLEFLKKVKYIVLLRQILAFMLDQDNAQFLRKRRPPKGVLWVGGLTLKAIRELSWDSNSPYGAKWVSEELLTGNIYDKQMTSKKQARWAAWSNLPRNNEAEEASLIFSVLTKMFNLSCRQKSFSSKNKSSR